jgi:hypothetical protein
LENEPNNYIGTIQELHMVLDRSFIERNRSSTNRIRALAARLSDEEMLHPVGEHWTVAIALAHLAFWDRRVMYVLDKTGQDGKLFIPEIDIFVNDLSLHASASKPQKCWINVWRNFRKPG